MRCNWSLKISGNGPFLSHCIYVERPRDVESYGIFWRDMLRGLNPRWRSTVLYRNWWINGKYRWNGYWKQRYPNPPLNLPLQRKLMYRRYMRGHRVIILLVRRIL